MKRKFLFGAALSALMLAAIAPWSASHANGVSVRVSTPEFGIRIGAPHFPVFQPVPVYRPVPVYPSVPVYYPRPYRYAPPAVIYTPPPRWGYAGYRGYGYDQWRHQHGRHDRGRGHNDHWNGNRR
ncbi:MAG TPA: hypothetical protein VJU53_03960 [Burkholderiaceae bacterium]|nr:hypothetical protein [Burkholderiaceae bacterium]